jgi:hypothetical protein
MPFKKFNVYPCPSDYSIRRRFRASCTELERTGADEDTAAGFVSRSRRIGYA